MQKISAVLLIGIVAALQGCKHPLAIEGQGDIVELNGSGRGCTLEQYRERDPACIDNTVDGDYFVNYKAVPRSGWRFVRWRGPCSANSDFQHCELNVSAGDLQRLQENFPGVNASPSIAVFQRARGETGYLLAGTPVAGVSYETDSLRGITGLDGSFQYEPGETVTFSLGGNPLGTSQGKERVTPFDLAGSAAIAGTPNIRRALAKEDHPFTAATNLTVLLQSLDRDADADNGIVITPGVASMLRGVALNLEQKWDAFREDHVFRALFASARDKGRFSIDHGMINPGPAMRGLYQALEIDADTMALARESGAFNGRGLEAVRYEYDEAGNLVAVRRPETYMQGDDVSRFHTQDYKYDDFGNMLRFEKRNYAEDELELFGEFLFVRSLSAVVETRSYDDLGWIIRRRQWRGTPELGPDDPDVPADLDLKMVEDWQYEYANSERMFQVTTRVRTPPPGSETVTRFYYDEQGRLLSIDMIGTGIPGTANQLGIPDVEFLSFAGGYDSTYEINYEYDAAGSLAREVREGDRPDFGRRRETRYYDESGLLTKMEASTLQYSDSSDPATENVSVHRYEYNEHGDLVRETVTSAEDGSLLRTDSWHYTYDEQGKLLRKEVDLESDGIPDEIIYREYRHGHLVREERDPNGDGRVSDITVWEYDGDGYLLSKGSPGELVYYEYGPTGWGHIFSSAPLGNPRRD